MGNNAVKTIVLLMVLVVLSFVIGAQISDNVEDSVGAFAVIGVIVGGALMIYMGPKVWQLLFLLPPFIELIPFHLFVRNIALCSAAPYAVAAVILPYWCVLWSLGRAKICWRGAAILDIPFLVFVGFMVVAYIRHPVVLNVMGMDYDSVGGEEIAVLFFVIAHYLVLSIIPISKQEFENCLAWSFKGCLVAAVVGIVFKLSKGEVGLGVSRCYIFFTLGSILFFWAYAKFPISRFLTSVRCWGILLFSMAAALVTGQRQNMAYMFSGIVFISCVKREMTIFILGLLFSYITVILVGEMGILESMPSMVQRSLSSVPGLKVSREAKGSGAGTMKTRYAIWSYAFDPRTGVIKDYIWGDGFAFSKAYMLRAQVAYVRGTGAMADDMEAMTVSRNFHNGAIHTISRIGYVGFAWCLIMCVIAWGVSIQVLRVWRHTESYPYIVLGLIPMPTVFLTYGYATYTTRYFLLCLQGYFFLKLCYCIARENGLLRPLLFEKRYVPLMIQEAEKAI